MTYTCIHVCTHTRIHTCVYVYIFVRFHPLCYEPRTRARYFYFGAERPAPRAPRRMQAPSNANCRRGHLVSLRAHHRRDTARRPRSGPFSRDFSSAHLHTGAIYHELQDYRLGENEINVHIHSSLLEFVWLCFQYCRFTLFPPPPQK